MPFESFREKSSLTLWLSGLSCLCTMQEWVFYSVAFTMPQALYRNKQNYDCLAIK